MLKPLYLLLSLVTLTHLFSLENDSYRLTTFGGVPAATVAGGVNVITGDYSLSQDDYIVKSHEPITITRTYSSLDGKTPFIG